MGFNKSKGCGISGGDVPGNKVYKGIITKPADFPVPTGVQIGDFYTIGDIEVIITLTNNGSGTATAVVSPEFYSRYNNGDNIIISNYTGSEADYNGTFVGTKATPNTITFSITGTPPTPATQSGTIATPDIVIDNDPTRTNTQQVFNNNDDALWVGDKWILSGADRIFYSDGKKIKQKNPALDIEVGNVLRGTINDVKELPAGFVDLDNAVVTLDAGLRKLTVAVDSGEDEYIYYTYGTRYIETSSQETTFSDLAGVVLFKFDRTFGGQLQATPNASLSNILQFRDNEATAAIGYWNKTYQKMIVLGDERYELPQNSYTRAYEAYFLGLQLSEKGALNGFSVDGDGSSNAHAQFGIEGAGLRLAMRSHGVSSVASTIGAPVMYFIGANAELMSNQFSGYSVFQVGIGRIGYNHFTGGAWQVTQVTDNYFVNYFPIFTTDFTESFFSVMGAAEYATAEEAIAGAPYELEQIMGRLPKIPYFVAGCVVFQTSDSFTNVVKSRVVSVNGANYLDLRSQKLNDANKKYKFELLLKEANIYYRRTSGNDSKSGRNNTDGFLTYSKPFTEIAAQTPTINKQYAVKTFDAGEFNGSCDMSSVTFTHVDAPNTIIRSNDCTINSDCSLKANAIERLSGVGNVLTKVGSGHAIIKTNKIENPIATGGGIFLNEGTVDIETKDLRVANRTDTLITANPGTANKILHLDGENAKGRIFTTGTTDKYYIHTKGINDCDLNINAASEIHLYADVWNGEILSAGALAEIYLHFNKRTSNPLNDTYDNTTLIHVIKPQEIWHYTSSQTLKITQAGDIFTNKGATGNINLTLPIANLYTEGKPFIISSLEDYRITVNSSSSAIRFVEANGDSVGAGASFTVNPYSSAKFINIGEFGAYGYWMIIPQLSRWNA